MDPIFEDFLAKKTDLLEGTCSCNRSCVCFIDISQPGYYTHCKQCNKKLYFLMCPKCKSGYAYAEDAKEVHLNTNNWFCGICKQDVSGLPDQEIQNFQYRDLPPKVVKLDKSRSPNWKVMIPFIIFGIIYFYLRYFKS